MNNINLTIDQDDLKCLFIACKLEVSFATFEKDCYNSYRDYYSRNINNVQVYGEPKTFSQWVNAQIIALTS
jgi:hypothetical protein